MADSDNKPNNNVNNPSKGNNPRNQQSGLFKGLRVSLADPWSTMIDRILLKGQEEMCRNTRLRVVRDGNSKRKSTITHLAT